MPQSNPLSDLLEAKGVLLADGATGTSLFPDPAAPRAPSVSDPQHHAVPSALIAQACVVDGLSNPPMLTCDHGPASEICTGAD